MPQNSILASTMQGQSHNGMKVKRFVGTYELPVIWRQTHWTQGYYVNARPWTVTIRWKSPTTTLYVVGHHVHPSNTDSDSNTEVSLFCSKTVQLTNMLSYAYTDHY